MAKGKSGMKGSNAETERVFRQLCHQISLDRTGKVQGAVDSLVLTMLSIAPDVGAGDANDVATAISEYFGLTLPVGSVRLAIENHLRSRRLVTTQVDGRSCIVLSDSCREELARRISGSQEHEALVREEWLADVAVRWPGLDPDKLWSALQAYLGGAFQQHGAETVQLLTATARGGNATGLFAILHDAVSRSGLASQADEAKAAIASFLDTDLPSRRRYLSELLDGTFTFYALTVGDATADYLKGQLPATKLFLDTNVILGLLELHDNPMALASIEVVKFIKDNNFPYKFYYHERTLKELHETVDLAAGRLRANRNHTVAVSKAIMLLPSSSQWITGIERKFHELNANGPIDVDVFLSKFEAIDELLDEMGVKIYRQGGPDFDVDEKGKLIAEFEHFADQKRPGRPRPYKARDHDVVVWMSLQRQRQKGASALNAGALFLTNDVLLLDFDRSYLSRHAGGGSTVILPQHLLQVLRPLARSAGEVDQRFLEVFAAPEFRTSQSEYDGVKQKVLTYFATYEDVPTATAVRILSNDVLLGRLKSVESEDGDFGALLESAVFEDNALLQAQLEEERVAAEEQLKAVGEAHQAALDEAAALRSKTVSLSDAAEAERRQKEEAQARAESAEAESSKMRAAHEAELAAERARADEREAEAERARKAAAALRGRVRWGLAFALAVIGLFVIWRGALVFEWSWFEVHEKRVAIQVCASAALLSICYGIVRPHHWWQALSVVGFSAFLTLLSLL